MGKIITITESQFNYVVNNLLTEDDDMSNLIDSIKIGDKNGFTKLYDNLYPKLMKKSYKLKNRFSDDDINQIINNAILRVFKGINLYSGTGSFDGWVSTIFNRAIADYVNKEKKYQENIIFPEKIVEPEQSQSRHELGKEFLAKFEIFKKLITKKQATYVELYLNGYTHSEIGKLLGTTDKTSKWQVSIILSKFKRWLVNNKDI